MGKYHRDAIPKNQAGRANEPLELVHSDLCGPMQTPTPCGNKYIPTFIYGYSRRCRIYFLRNKPKVFFIFKKFKAIVELQSGYSLKKLRTKGG